ncbi:unnamed protein product, partial [Heterotrigona itama]
SQLDCMGIMEQHVFTELLFSAACTKVLGRMMGTRPRSSTEKGTDALLCLHAVPYRFSRVHGDANGVAFSAKQEKSAIILLL